MSLYVDSEVFPDFGYKTLLELEQQKVKDLDQIHEDEIFQCERKLKKANDKIFRIEKSIAEVNGLKAEIKELKTEKVHTCILCSTCTEVCDCPRCPLQLRADQCQTCGMLDDRNCTTEYCIIQDHYTCRIDMYCQICVEEKYGFVFHTNKMGKYCEDHKNVHKERIRSKRSNAAKASWAAKKN
jgi:hypothetical protein